MSDPSTPGSSPGSLDPRTEREIVRTLEPIDEIRLAVLFGSAASGKVRPQSDLDIGIWMRSPDDASSLSDLRVRLERATGKVVDLICLHEAPPLLRFEIARGGRVLLERSPHDWADFRAKTMIDWWDWAPTARIVHRAVAARLAEEAAHGSR